MGTFVRYAWWRCLPLLLQGSASGPQLVSRAHLWQNSCAHGHVFCLGAVVAITNQFTPGDETAIIQTCILLTDTPCLKGPIHADLVNLLPCKPGRPAVLML